jgi:hypothetical protein
VLLNGLTTTEDQGEEAAAERLQGCDKSVSDWLVCISQHENPIESAYGVVALTETLYSLLIVCGTFHTTL